MVLANQKHLFDIPPDVTYLNCSYMSPLSLRVKEAGASGIQKRGAPWELKISDWFDPGEQVRKLVASLIHSDPENIGLIPSVSYGIAVAAKNITLKPHQTIVLLDQQYPSNVYPWRNLSRDSGATLITVTKEHGQSWTEALTANITEATGLVAVPNCHWTDGSLIDLEVISARAKRVGSHLVIDASQSLGAYPLDIRKIRPDFLVSVGYKWLMGSYGLGYLYADDRYCRDGVSIEEGWLNRKGSEDFSRLVDYRDELKSGGRRFDGGEYPDFVRLPMAIAALTQVSEWGVADIQETLAGLTAEIERRAQLAGYEAPRRADRVGHMIGIKIPPDQVAAISRKLADRRVFVSFRGSSMRVAPHLYNDVADIQKLCDLL
jgi:selenocysteine lyase/cysteine desulfurase